MMDGSSNEEVIKTIEQLIEEKEVLLVYDYDYRET